MNQYKNILLWSSIILSLFKATSVAYGDENQHPIYDPINPNQQVQPLENANKNEAVVSIEDSSESISETQESSEKLKETYESSTMNSSPIKKHQKKVKKKKEEKIYLTKELFNGNKDIVQNSGLDGDDPGPDNLFYAQLIDELVGTAIYGRKS
ncbi:hypothetical protein PF023_03545 [Enterococcus thailandicus]|uniref:hypothetical protein n=1 Tax=Enterococcus thailandicus TaxID=417368 RepID=UPI0022EBCCCE|nr:hypothetical protein [Enterococcus thailandicus]MDA3973109.1 hypothetical protein [Enterococcus thailandicus]MDA3975457.1 hypothetical protein [Enterococcus thailandicus]MDA3980569.1 hypothetical protein [Enterococcus thailandicus]